MLFKIYVPTKLMLGKLMGIMDLLTGILLILFQYSTIPFNWIFPFAMYLLLKLFIFWGDSMSIIDGFIGIYIFLMLLFKIEIVSFVFFFYLILKSMWSMM